MNCRSFKLNIAAYQDGELSERLRVAADQHLQDCHRCRRELAQVKAVCRMVKDTGEVEPPADFEQNLHRMIQRGDSPARQRAVPSWRPLPNWAWAAAVAAAASICIVVGVALTDRIGDRSPPGVSVASADSPTPVNRLSLTPPPGAEAVAGREGGVTVEPIDPDLVSKGFPQAGPLVMDEHRRMGQLVGFGDSRLSHTTIRGRRSGSGSLEGWSPRSEQSGQQKTPTKTQLSL